MADLLLLYEADQNARDFNVSHARWCGYNDLLSCNGVNALYKVLSSSVVLACLCCVAWHVKTQDVCKYHSAQARAGLS